MKAVFLVVITLGVVSALDLSALDPEACVTRPDPPITRVIDASVPVAFSPPGFNYSYPDESAYTENTVCQWQINLADKPLILSFFNFSVEDDQQCSFDNVTVWDGPDDTNTPIVVLCGELGHLLNYFTASNGSLFVRFQSDTNGIVGKGFAGRVGPPVDDTACDGIGPQVFTEPQGIFMTKNFPINYPNNALCEYSFQPPAGQKVELTFDQSDMAQNCNDDYLDVFEGQDYAFATFAAGFSGNMRPPKMTSVGNGLYMRFVSNAQRTAEGFLGSYSFVPA